MKADVERSRSAPRSCAVHIRARRTAKLCTIMHAADNAPDIWDGSNESQRCPATIAIRLASVDDLPDLLELEASCRGAPMRSASEATLHRRLTTHRRGQFAAVAADGRLLGAVYTQRVASCESLLRATHTTELDLHTPAGPVLQLLSAVQRPEAAGIGRTLRDHVLSLGRMDSSVEWVCTVARCGRYDACGGGEAASSDAYQSYVDYVEAGTDPWLLLHSSAGASIGAIIPNYRPDDISNLGYGVLVTYHLREESVPRLDAPFAPSSIEHYQQIEYCQQTYRRPRSGLRYVVASSARWPGGVDSRYTGELWAGADAIGTIPAQRWDVPPTIFGASHFGAFVNCIERFAPTFFDMAHGEVHATDPQQRLLLEEGYTALHAAHARRLALHEADVGIFLGIMNADFAAICISASSVFTATGAAISIAAGRLSFICGMQGPSISYDTACSSALIASHAACKSVSTEECGSGLVLAASLMLTPQVIG